MWTPQDEAEYQSLKAQYGTPEPESTPVQPRKFGAIEQAGSWGTRALQHAGNFAGNVGRTLSSPIVNLAGMASGMEDNEREVMLQNYQRGFNRSANVDQNFAPSTGAVDTVIDVAGNVAPAIYSLMIPGTAATKAAGALGAGAITANIAGDVAAGAYSGLGESPQEAALQAGEFGLGGAAMQLGGRRFGSVGKAVVGGLANAGVATAGQVARGNDISTPEALTHIATQGLFPVAMEGAGAVSRRFGRRAQEPTIDQSTDLEQVPANDPGVAPIPEGRGGTLKEAPLVAASRHLAGSEGTGGTGSKPGSLFNNERNKLEEWAKEGNVILPDGHLDGLQKLESGTEHSVYLDEATGRVLKSTHPESFGTSNRGESWAATPSDYLERLELHNQVFGDDVKLEGVTMKDGKMQVVTSQPHIKGGPPTPAEVSEYLKSKGFEEVSLGGINEWHNKDINILASDTKPENFIKGEDGSIFPIDLVVSQPKGEILRRIESQPQKLRPLGRKSEQGSIDPVLSAHLAGAAVGGTIGAINDDENRGRGAALGALAGAGLVAGGRRLGRMNISEKIDDAARSQLKGETSRGGKTSRFIQQNVIGASDDLKTVQQQAQGRAASEQQALMQAIDKGRKDLANLTPAQKAIVEEYHNSAGAPADEAKLSGLTPDARAGAIAIKRGINFGKEAQRGATTDKDRQAMLDGTDDYSTQSYRIHLDPESHKFDEAHVQQVVDENMALPEYKGLSRAEVEDDVRNYMARTRALAEGKPDVQGGSTRMDKTMYMQRKELRPEEAQILEGLANDPRLTSDENAKFADMLTNGVTPEGQALMRTMAKDPRINHVELLKAVKDGLTPKEGMWIKAALNKKMVPAEAFEMLEKMASNSKVPPAYQQRLLELVNDAKTGKHRTFHTDEADALAAIGNKSILSESRKKLLGVIEDPLEKKFLTARKLLNDSQKALLVGKLLTDSNSAGRYHLPKEDWSQALITAEKAGDKASVQKLTDYVDVPDGPQFGGLAGGKVQREVADALQIGPNHKGLNPLEGGLMAYANAIPKIVFTRLNPAAHMHNAVSSVLQGTAMGVVNPVKIATHWKKVLTDPAIRTELEHNGILGSGIGSDMNRTAKNFDLSLNPTRFGKLKEVGGKVMDKINDVYGYSDNVMRAAGYLQNKPRFVKAGIAKGLSGDALEKFAQHETTKFVNQFSNNYGQTSNLARTLSNVPLVNPFIRYQEQNLKVIKNLARDLIKGAPEDQKRAAIALTVFMAVPATVYAGMKAMLGKDQAEYEQMEKTMPSYMRARLQVPLGKNQETGEFSSFNLQPWMPSGDIVSFAKNILHGDGEALLMNNPLFGLNQTPALNMISEQMTGQDSFTGRKFNTAGDRIHAVTKNFTPSWFPGNYAADKLVAGFSENDKGGRGLTDSRTGKRETPGSATASLFGFSKSIQSPKRLADRLRREADEKISSFRSEMRAVLRSNVPTAEKQEARQLFQRRREQVIRKFNERVGK